MEPPRTIGKHVKEHRNPKVFHQQHNKIEDHIPVVLKIFSHLQGVILDPDIGLDTRSDKYPGE
jgi:methionine synthase II (cobalamin-independent)